MTKAQTYRADDFSPSVSDVNIVQLMKAREGKNRPAKKIEFASHPLLKALKEAGTKHIYTDTADQTEMLDLLLSEETDDTIRLFGEIDGNTTNQPLIDRVLNRYIDAESEDGLVNWVKSIQRYKRDLTIEDAVILVYSIINGRLGLEVTDYYRANRIWEISLELHTSLASQFEKSKLVGWYLNRAVPNSFVKVALTPNHPHCLLIARDLERQNIPVNFTATFSARQIVAAALLANPSRTNIFLGRLSQGLYSELLGEQVVVETQKHVKNFREKYGVKTLNMLASVRRPETMSLTAGCDVYTIPYPVLKEFMNSDIAPESITNQTQASYEDQLDIDEQVLAKISAEKIKQLYTVEPEFIEFLLELRNSQEYDEIDGDGLYKRFDEAGFGDFFYSPNESEWKEIRKGKLPNLDSEITKKLPLDTLYTLLAFGDFMNFQDAMDKKIREPIQHLFT
ncbi:MAG: transaldolase family protein [Pyrinomonadaceae bacterium]